MRARIVRAGLPDRADGLLPGGDTEVGGALPQGTPRGARAALLRRSVESGKASVFAVVNGDGSISAVRAGKTDRLAPAGTIATAPAAAVTSKASGIVLNWVPDPILYIADPNRNGVVVLDLVADGAAFRVARMHRLDAPALNRPIDMAPAVVESINPDFASNRTLAGEADFYIANRGDGTIVRMSQQGKVLAVRRLSVPGLGLLGPERLNGIAVAADATRLWVSISGQVPPFRGADGAILELPAFSAGRAADLSPGAMRLPPAADETTDIFLQMGLGPAFNGRSCADCHRSPVAGGMGPDGIATVVRVGRLDSHGYDPMLGHGGPIARRHSVAELGIACAVSSGIPPGANLISVRNAPTLFGLGLVDEIPDATIIAGAVPYRNGIHGHPNVVTGADGSKAVGRFGWKAEIPQLEQFVADALRDEHGITSPLAAVDLSSDATTGPACAAIRATPKDNGKLVAALTSFVRSLEPLVPAKRDARGRDIFVKTGCADCHTLTLTAHDKVLPLYSDLLLHDMGPALNDGVVQGEAQGADWRTTPLWGLSVRERFLHDGRAHSIEAAILAHGGEADQVVQAFRKLDHPAHSALLGFLSSL